ncbi:MAG: 50S ribosomal protein L30e [Candidatus Hodarchaeota archaeon]
MKQDIEKAISMAMSTGKVKLGYDAVLKSILSGKIKAAVISNNLSINSKDILLQNCKLSEVPIIEYEKSGTELGAICGRPHKVSTIGIIDPGNSKILEYLK